MNRNTIKIAEKLDDVIRFADSYFSSLNPNHLKLTGNNSLETFCNKYIDLIKTINPDTPQNHNKNLFDLKIDLLNKGHYNSHLIASKIYIENILGKLDKPIRGDIYTEIRRIPFDYAPILAAIQEKVNKDQAVKQSKEIIKIGTRAMIVDKDIAIMTAINIFTGMTAEGKLPYFISGYSIFAIRQSIELAGKEILKLKFIRFLKGNKPFHGSMVPWHFLKEQHDKGQLQLVINPDDIFVLYRWANSFTHGGQENLCYVVFSALEIMKKILKSKSVIHVKDIRNSDDLTKNLQGKFKYYLSTLNDHKSRKKTYSKFKKKRSQRNLLVPIWDNVL